MSLALLRLLVILILFLAKTQTSRETFPEHWFSLHLRTQILLFFSFVCNNVSLLQVSLFTKGSNENT